YPQKACHLCHSSDAWASVSFDHRQTGLELQGKHLTTSCTACHKPDDTTVPERVVSFSGLSMNCSSCHDNIHDRQFEREGLTDCRRCHSFDALKPGHFDHNTARFVLTGAHLNVECRACHKEETVEGRPVIQYRMERFECADCHM